MAKSGLTQDRWSDLQLPSFAIGLDQPQHRGLGIVVEAFFKKIAQPESKGVPCVYERLNSAPSVTHELRPTCRSQWSFLRRARDE